MSEDGPPLLPRRGERGFDVARAHVRGDTLRIMVAMRRSSALLLALFLAACAGEVAVSQVAAGGAGGASTSGAGGASASSTSPSTSSGDFGFPSVGGGPAASGGIVNDGN